MKNITSNSIFLPEIWNQILEYSDFEDIQKFRLINNRSNHIIIIATIKNIVSQFFYDYRIELEEENVLNDINMHTLTNGLKENSILHSIFKGIVLSYDLTEINGLAIIYSFILPKLLSNPPIQLNYETKLALKLNLLEMKIKFIKNPEHNPDLWDNYLQKYVDTFTVTNYLEDQYLQLREEARFSKINLTIHEIRRINSSLDIAKQDQLIFNKLEKEILKLQGISYKNNENDEEEVTFDFYLIQSERDEALLKFLILELNHRLIDNYLDPNYLNNIPKDRMKHSNLALQIFHFVIRKRALECLGVIMDHSYWKQLFNKNNLKNTVAHIQYLGEDDRMDTDPNFFEKHKLAAKELIHFILPSFDLEIINSLLSCHEIYSGSHNHYSYLLESIIKFVFANQEKFGDFHIAIHCKPFIQKQIINQYTNRFELLNKVINENEWTTKEFLNSNLYYIMMHKEELFSFILDKFTIHQLLYEEYLFSNNFVENAYNSTILQLSCRLFRTNFIKQILQLFKDNFTKKDLDVIENALSTIPLNQYNEIRREKQIQILEELREIILEYRKNTD